MGHYASEMACPACHQCRCRCPAPADLTLNHWVVDADFSVIVAHEFQKKYGYISLPGGTKVPDAAMGRMARIACDHFETKELAQVHAIELLKHKLAKRVAETAALTQRLAELLALEDTAAA